MLPGLLLIMVLQVGTAPQAASAIADAQRLLDAEGRRKVEKAVADFQSRSRRSLAIEVRAQLPESQNPLAASLGLPAALRQWAQERMADHPRADFLLVYCQQPPGLVIVVSPRVTEAQFPRHRFEEIDQNVKGRLERHSAAEAVQHAVRLLQDYFAPKLTPGRMRIGIMPPTPPLPPELQAKVDEMMGERKAEAWSGLIWLLWLGAGALALWLIWGGIRYSEFRREHVAASPGPTGFAAYSQEDVSSVGSRFGSPLALGLRAWLGDGMGAALFDRLSRKDARAAGEKPVVASRTQAAEDHGAAP